MFKPFEILSNCKLVGLSIDGLYSHIAWLRKIKEKTAYKGMKDVEVILPLIEDIKMDVAKKYGMIQPNEDSTKAVRAVSRFIFLYNLIITCNAIAYNSYTNRKSQSYEKN